MNVLQFKEALVKVIAACPQVLGIGQTGDMNAPLVPGQSDIDMFVICSAVPSREERMAIYGEIQEECDELQMQVADGGIWGYGDIFLVNQIDVMPMFFEIGEMEAYLDEVLAGKHLEREGRFYPVGRLATIETMNILYEKNDAWTNLIQKVKKHPQSFFDSWYSLQEALIIDKEDISRVKLRKEVLFYHQVLEEALDHFLQALYAKNRTYFPSRKRNQQDIEAFIKKPVNCCERLLSIVEAGARQETLMQSVDQLIALAEELKALN